MKAIVTLGSLEMTIENKQPFTKPVIHGSLWKFYSSLDLAAWCFIYGQPEVNTFIEVDFALALTKDPLLKVEFVDPIEGYQAGEYETV